MAFEVDVVSSKILAEVKIFRPSVGRDSRGTIFTTYTNEFYDNYLPSGLLFNHDKFAESKQHVLRGLHGDSKTWKLISCIYGEIFQVVVDIRPESSTYLKWDSWLLNDQNKLQILVPSFYVNGYYVKSKNATFHYKLAYKGEYFDVGQQFVVKWNDTRLDIKWPTNNPILQDRDK
jgi:dTDP-4-dehydrorhamnose 3,5-epimerase